MAQVVTNAQHGIVTAALAASDMKYLGWGTGAGTAAAADTTLFTEASEARVIGTQSQETTTVADDTYRVVGSIVADADKTITNAGLFDALTGGNLGFKRDFAGVALTTGESMELAVEIVYA